MSNPKTLLSFAIITLALSCNSTDPKEEKTSDPNLILFSGQIEQCTIDSISLFNTVERIYENPIMLKEGAFNDTLDLAPGMYQAICGDAYFGLYLEKGYDLEITADLDNFKNSIVFNGSGEKTNNLLVDIRAKEEQIFIPLDDKDLDRRTYESYLDSLVVEMLTDLEATEITDTSIFENKKSGIQRNKEFALMFFDEAREVEKLQGLPSPDFNYENVAGELISLSNFKGSYLYIDIWATWCGPCIGEIPYLKELEADYKDKSIKFLSISIDNMEDKEKWKSMVTEKELGGSQVIASEAWQSDFVKAYHVSGIPRFILIDPEGNVVDGKAPRPSDEEIRTVLDNLL